MRSFMPPKGRHFYALIPSRAIGPVPQLTIAGAGEVLQNRIHIVAGRVDRLPQRVFRQTQDGRPVR
jgi:hypothetical protein